ncbi:MAG: hypothetical protein QOE63_1145 [Acidimicrobiaceae bacterium]
MTDLPSDAGRERLIAGDRAGWLTPDEAADLVLLADLLGDPSTWAEPSAGLEDTIVQAVASAEPAMPKPPSIAARRSHPWRRRVALSAAAAIVLVTGAIVSFGGGTNAAFTADLTATALAPGARGSAAVTPNDGGFRISLRAGGLPPLTAGQYYEAWLKNATGTLVPIGTFSSSDSDITLWSGVSPKDFPTLTVTIEYADNDQASSGRVVLIGDAHP